MYQFMTCRPAADDPAPSFCLQNDGLEFFKLLSAAHLRQQTTPLYAFCQTILSFRQAARPTVFKRWAVFLQFIPPEPNLSRSSRPRRHVSGDTLGMGRSGEPLPIPAVHPAGSEFVAWQSAAAACQRRHARNGEKRGTAPDTGGSSRRFRICRAAASRGGLSAATRRAAILLWRQCCP